MWRIHTLDTAQPSQGLSPGTSSVAVPQNTSVGKEPSSRLPPRWLPFTLGGSCGTGRVCTTCFLWISQWAFPSKNQIVSAVKPGWAGRLCCRVVAVPEGPRWLCSIKALYKNRRGWCGLRVEFADPCSEFLRDHSHLGLGRSYITHKENRIQRNILVSQIYDIPLWTHSCIFLVMLELKPYNKLKAS